jgi:probable HAF family extracellular repeat protein
MNNSRGIDQCTSQLASIAWFVFLLCSSFAASAAFAQEPTFTPLGTFGETRSAGHDVSADGSVVVGTAYDASTDIYEVFRWTLQGIAGATPLSYSNCAVSADGVFIVATEPRLTMRPNGVAIRWSDEGGLDRLGELPNGTGSAAYDVSANGAVVVGASGTFLGRTEAFRWTEATGMLPLGGLQGVPGFSQALGVSADGAVIVGEATDMNNRRQAFRWTESTGLIRLALPPNATTASAQAVTPDGSILVGSVGFPATGREALRWTQTDGMIGLGDLPGGRVIGVANDVSADGSVIVGDSETFYQDGVRAVNEAFYWTASSGMLNLRDLLVSSGVTGLNGWMLTEANGVSADGLTVVGTAIDSTGVQQAFVATIPEPSTIALASSGLAALLWFYRRAKLQKLNANGPMVKVTKPIAKNGNADRRMRTRIAGQPRE